MTARPLLLLAFGSALWCCAAPAAQRHARISIRCDDPQAQLTVDGVPRGTAQDYAGAHRLLLAAGTHRLALQGTRGLQERQIEVGADDDVTLNIAMAGEMKALGEIR